MERDFLNVENQKIDNMFENCGFYILGSRMKGSDGSMYLKGHNLNQAGFSRQMPNQQSKLGTNKLMFLYLNKMVTHCAV